MKFDVPIITDIEGSSDRRLTYARCSGDVEIFATKSIDLSSNQHVAFIRLLALYIVVGGAGLLFSAYLALTHWIVRPIVILEGAARRVEQGGLMTHSLVRAPAELLNLSKSMVTMTQRLRSEEANLREKIEELKKKKQELASAQDSLIRSERLASVGHLAAGLAHEVGNPLSAILGILDLLADEGLSESERQDFIQRMKRETERIHQIMHDLLTFSRPHPHAPSDLPKDNGTDLSDDRCNASEAIHEVLQLLKPQQSFKGIEISTQISASVPPLNIKMDELIQVLLNLLLNARDALKGKGNIKIGLIQQGAVVHIDIIDNGPGVAKEFKETLFEPFVTNKEVGQGTGLGLSISRGLIASSGGQLELISSSAEGACFRIQLPIVRDSQPAE